LKSSSIFECAYSHMEEKHIVFLFLSGYAKAIGTI